MPAHVAPPDMAGELLNTDHRRPGQHHDGYTGNISADIRSPTYAKAFNLILIVQQTEIKTSVHQL
jgi:hypothetical protein